MSRHAKRREAARARKRAADERARTARPEAAEASRFTDTEREAAEAAFNDLLARQRDRRQESER